MKFTKSKLQSKNRFFILALSFSLSFSFLFSSCKKDDEDENPKEDSYYPITVGSTWTYQDDDIITYINTITNETKNAEGFSWLVMEATSDADNLLADETLIRLDPTTNIIYHGFDFTSDGGSFLSLPVIDLDAKVGDSWEARIEEDGFFIAYTSTVLEKDVSKTVNGKNYDKIMVVKNEESTNIVGGITNNSTYYFAAGIGLVAEEYEDGGYSRLIDYSIK